MLKKALKTSLQDVKLAVTLRSQESDSQKSILQRLVQLVEEKREFLLSQARTDLYIAAIALLK